MCNKGRFLVLEKYSKQFVVSSNIFNIISNISSTIFNI